MKEQWYVIVNPTSGAGKCGKKWPDIRRRMEDENINFVYGVTNHERHSIDMIKEEVAEGYRNFVCVGGDGTLHNMVNGILSQDIVPSTDITTAMISIGTGNDWIRTHNIPADPMEALQLIRNGQPFLQDAGHVQFAEGSRYFVNFAGVGFDAEVVKRTEKSKSSGQSAYLLGLLKTLFGYKNVKLKLSFNEQELEERAFLIFAALGIYGGGSMMIAPDAIPDDGLLDLTFVKDLSKMDVILNIGKLFKGTYKTHPKISMYRTAQLRIESLETERAVYMEADGEMIGTGPFELSVRPKALRFMGPKA